MSPEITRETFENGPGKQTGLFDTDECVETHSKLREKYNLEKCPNCGRIITQTTESKAKQTQKKLTDY